MMPDNMIKYAAPDAKHLVETLSRAIMHDVKDVVPEDFHQQV